MQVAEELKPIGPFVIGQIVGYVERDEELRRRSKTNARWHIVHCVGKSDRHVVDWLKRLELETYYPGVREMRAVPKKELSQKQRKSGVKVMRPQVVPLFPRYMFVRFDMGKNGWRDMFRIAGVGGMVCHGEMPVWVPDGLIDDIRGKEVDGAVPGKTPAHLIFKVGEEVRVSGGPFASFLGVVDRLPTAAIEEIDPDDRIKVVIDIFGRSTSVDLEISQIEKL